MDHLLDDVQHNLLNPKTLIGAVVIGVLLFVVTTALAAVVRRAAGTLRPHLSDVTGFSFASGLVQVFVYLVGFIFYAHLVPALQALGTALLAWASIISVVVGFAAQNTLGNLVAGLSLVLYRPISVDDSVQLDTPKGLVTATVEVISLGYTTLRDGDRNQIIVPNSVMMSSVVIRLDKEAK